MSHSVDYYRRCLFNAHLKEPPPPPQLPHTLAVGVIARVCASQNPASGRGCACVRFVLLCLLQKARENVTEGQEERRYLSGRPRDNETALGNSSAAPMRAEPDAAAVQP